MLTSNNEPRLNFAKVREEIRRSGFAFVTGAEMTAALTIGSVASDWNLLADSWNNLGLDLYMADGGRYRRRRFAAFRISLGDISRKPHQPHYQSRDYNRLNGDIERWFEPIDERICFHPSIQALFAVCGKIFSDSKTNSFNLTNWHAEMHQFRIEAGVDNIGCPTPEGLHRDGVDWVSVMLINRRNVQSGTTEIFYDRTKKSNKFTLTNPLDTVFLDDTRVRHGVTPILRLIQEVEGYRDVLVLTFRRVSN